MYTMPGEVINGEKPGVFGLSLYRVFAGFGGFMVGQLIFGNNFIALAICAGLGIILARKTRGLYLGQEVYYRLYWLFQKRTETALQLDPAQLYQTQKTRTAGAIIIRQADGSMITVK